jgi:hypothetical protein
MLRLQTLTVLALALGPCVPSYATTTYFSGTTIPIPAGLVQGDCFQLVFVTGENYTGASTNIGDYNADVTTSANEATSLVAGLGITWSVLGSTAAVNVLSNIVNTSPSITNFEGIYDLGGNLIADGTETTGKGLYSGALQNFFDTTEYGTTIYNTVWTGTASNGSTTPEALGTADPFAGSSHTTNTTWTEAFLISAGSGSALYAISNPLFLGPGNTLLTQAPVPEPATIGMTLLGLASCYLAARRKRMVAPPKATTGRTPELR